MKTIAITIIMICTIALHAEQSRPLSTRSIQCRNFTISNFCGYEFGSKLPDNATTNIIVVQMEKPIRACTRFILGYHSHTRELITVDMQGDMQGWSYAAITNECEIMRNMLERKLGVPFIRDQWGTDKFNNQKVSISVMGIRNALPIQQQPGRRLQNIRNAKQPQSMQQQARGNLFCIRVSREDLREKANKAMRDEEQKRHYTINHAIPAGQDEERITFAH